MFITILYFHSAQRAAGLPQERLELPAGSLVADALAAALAAHPALAPLAPSLLVAINQEHASRQARLNDGDTLALMPPFSGG